MHRIIITILSVIGVSLAGSLPSFFHGQVVNGDKVVFGEIPYQVSIQYPRRGRHLCSGSILNEKYVLTAGDCLVWREVSLMNIFAATIDLEDPKLVHRAEELIIHEKYNESRWWAYNIGLIKIRDNFVVTEVLNFAPLPTKDYIVIEESLAQISGWGINWDGAKTPNILKKAEIIITPQDYCRDAYSGTRLQIDHTQICAYNPDKPTGSCHSDSGGPLVENGKLVGLEFFKNKCFKMILPGVYTRVTEYLDWIEANTVETNIVKHEMNIF